MRALKHHESKLLKKVDFLRWKNDDSMRSAEVMRRYGIEKREDYNRYSKIVGEVHKLVNKIKALDPADPFRLKMTEMLLHKLYVSLPHPARTRLAPFE
jgi:U3 small nucleolar ribonucleoprotein protein IMP3